MRRTFHQSSFKDKKTTDLPKHSYYDLAKMLREWSNGWLHNFVIQGLSAQRSYASSSSKPVQAEVETGSSVVSLDSSPSYPFDSDSSSSSDC